MNLTAFTFSGMLRSQPDLVARIHDLETLLRAGPQAECPVRNLFSPGIFMREMLIPAGVVLIGAEHRTRHMNVISKGRITVWTEDGMLELSAPYVFESLPGTKRAGYAHEDTIWTTIHANADDEQDMAVLTERLTTSKYSDLLENRIAIEGVKSCLLD